MKTPKKKIKATVKDLILPKKYTGQYNEPKPSNSNYSETRSTTDDILNTMVTVALMESAMSDSSSSSSYDSSSSCDSGSSSSCDF